MNNICDYDEAYTRADVYDIGWCSKCYNKKCSKNQSRKHGEIIKRSKEYYAEYRQSRDYKDCLSCANSFSEERSDGDILHCMLHNDIIVDDNEYCGEWN